MRKAVLILFLVLTTASATAFTSSLDAVERTAKAGIPAEFHLNVENTLSEEQEFTISSLQSPPPTGSWFYYSESKTLAPGENDSFVITVTPTPEAIQHNYRFNLVLRSSDGEKKSFQDYFAVRSKYDLEVTNVELNRNSFRPGETVNGSIDLINTDPRPVKYTVSSSFMGKNSTKSGTLLSGSEITHNFNFQIPSNTGPGEKTIGFRLGDSQGFQRFNQTLEVLQLRNIETDSSVEDRIFERRKTLSAHNRGNYRLEVTLNETIPNYLEPITVFNTPPDSEEESSGSTTYYWRFELEPGEEATVSYESRYWPPLVVITALFAGGVLLRKLRSGIEFRKKAVRSEEGLKVHIEIENKSGRTLRELEVTDFVPDVASINEEFPMAKPSIRKTGNGTRLTWEIQEMGPGEQRVFEYSIEPLVEVEDGIVLDSAKIEGEGIKVAETDKVEAEFQPD